MLITYMPGFQVFHWLYQAATCAVEQPRGWLSTDCPGQDMSKAVFCLSIIKKVNSPTLMAEDSVGQLGSVLISPNGGVPGKQRFQIQTAVFVEAKKIDSITLYQLCARVMGGD